MERPEEWKTVSEEKIADCRVFRVSERNSRSEHGREASFFVIESPDWVNVIPLTDDGMIVLIEQYRHGTEEVTLEIPGGMVDAGESPAECAARELTEETGYVPGEIILLGRSRPNPAIQNNWIHHFLATGCRRGPDQAFDEHESIAVRTVPVDGLTDLVEREEITHSLVLTGLLHYENYVKRSIRYSYES